MINLIKNFLIKSVFAAEEAFPVQPSSGGGSVTLYDPTGSGDIYNFIDKIANYMIGLAIGIAVIMVLIGAYNYLLSAGDPNKVKKGTNTILYAGIGVGVALIAKGLVGVMKSVFSHI